MLMTRSTAHLPFRSLTVLIGTLTWICAAVCPAAAQKMSPEKAALMARFENPKDYLPPSGAGGTEWDARYRTFIQTDAAAESKGLPTHAAAARQIVADAKKSSTNLDRHLGWVLHIKHFSQAYRPESATKDLRKLYEELVDLKLGATPRDRALAARGRRASRE